MSSRFDADTAVVRDGIDLFHAACHAGWRVVGDVAPNGGYLMAIAARAMAIRAERPDPVTLTAHFLAPPALGPLTIETELVREGGRHRTVAARLLQDGDEQVRLLGTFGDLSVAQGPTRVLRRSPDWGPVEELSDPVADLAGHPVPELLHRLDHRMPRGTTGWARREPSGDGVHGGYCRWPDTDTTDPFALLFIADAYPPAVFDLGAAEIAWAPTIELTVQVRARPDPGWLSARFETRALTDGYFEEDGEIWDSSGRLVAISRQLALAGRPRSTRG